MESNNKSVLVTGAAGFIGFHVSKALLEKGIEVIGLDNVNAYYDPSLKYARLSELGIEREQIIPGELIPSKKNGLFRFVKLDIVEYHKLNSLFIHNKIDGVIHLAAQAGVRYSIENPHAYVQSNLVGFVNILECCRYNHIEHLVYASSSSVYGNSKKVPFSEEDRVDHPISLYAATKKSNELMAHTYSHLYHLPTTGLRFFTVYGPWGRPDMAPMKFANAILDNQPIKVFNKGQLERDFTYIDDIVSGIISVYDNIPDENGEIPYYRIVNIGNSQPVKLMDFISCLEDALGIKSKKEMYPMQPGDVLQTFADTSKLKGLIDYRPSKSIDRGIREFINWFQNYRTTFKGSFAVESKKAY